MSRRRRHSSSQRLTAVDTAQDAALYDTQVVPRYSALFGRMLLRHVPTRERLQILDVGCGSGYPALEVLEQLPSGGRVIAVDPDPELIDLARRRALDDAGRRIFFKVESADGLSFGDEVFDVAVANLALPSFQQPEIALAEIHRVLIPGGRLLLTQPLAGTFEEVFDMFREVALKRDDQALSQRIDRIAARYPSPPTLEAVLLGAGFATVELHTEEFQLPFGSAAEVFTDPLTRFVALPEWRWIAGFDEGGEAILGQVREHLETYFGGGPLSLRVHAGLAIARA
ncbi:MAG TPA: methyltransferase domain-containing protein [Sandaracinaceae bacterium LLY-WYZ-13_1]|nr:methyltransferase domain-containing protein [Sandaracinaceae bacterium LLY-WYZ-13_1]